MKNKWTLITLIVVIAIHLFLLSNITFFPYPELFVYSYLTKSGLIPYHQIFDQHFPGLVFFPVNLATLGIDTVAEYRILQLSIVGLTHVLLFLVSKKLFKSNLFTLIPSLLYLIWQPFFEGDVLWIDSFVPPLLLGAYYFLISQSKKWNLFWAGILLGVSLLLKQVAGPLIVLIGLYLLYKERSIKKVIPYAIGVLIPVSYLLYWVTSLGIWSNFWYWAVTFNMTTFAEMGKTSATMGQSVRVMLVYGVAGLILVGSLLARIFNFQFSIFNQSQINKLRNDKNISLLAIFFIGSLLFAYARFDYVHLQPALPFAILILTYSAKYMLDTRVWRYYWIPAYAGMTIYLLIPFYRSNWNGSVRFNGAFEQEVSARVLEYANPGDSTFALGTMPHLYYLTETLPPGRVFVFQFPWFMVEAEGRIIEGIVNDPPKVVVRDRSAEVSGMKLVDYMKDIDTYVETNYHVVDNVDGTDVLIRN